MHNRKKVAVLGATGSVGLNALSALSAKPDDFEITALSAHNNTRLLGELAEKYSPSYVAVTGEGQKLPELPDGVAAGIGGESVIEACERADVVLLSILGIAGLPAFEYCLKNHIPVALATKEAMVCGGRLARRLMDETKTPVYPVDSELSAIWQCLDGNEKKDVKRVYLTASGGPFRTSTIEQIKNATKKQALNHPNWSMGEKITVDCATMVNKGLEIMETRWLFDIPSEKIQVAVHPESVVHSMVEFCDGVIMAQLGEKDMRLPILHALSYPERLEYSGAELDIFASELHFEKPDTTRFPCLALAYEAVREDGGMQLVLNSANEVAVDMFLKDRISFWGIYDVLYRAMNKFAGVTPKSFHDIYETDAEVRRFLSQESF